MVKKSIEDQLGLFGNSDFVAKIELGQAFQRIDEAIKQGLIPQYDCKSLEGIPLWVLVTAAQFKNPEGDPKKRDACCDLYAKKGSTYLVDPAQLPVELACLASYKDIEFSRSKKAVIDGAIIVSIGSGPGSLKQSIIDSGQTIPQSQSVRRVLTAKALIDYLDLGKHPLFNDATQSVGLESRVDQRILKACVNPVTASQLRNKAQTGKRVERRLYLGRIQYLIEQGKLYTWTSPAKGKRITYYCVTPPPDEPEPSPDVAEVEVVEVAQESPGALVPTDKALSKINNAKELALDQHDRLFLERFKDPRNEWFVGQCDKLSETLHGRPLPWVEFEGKKWLTVKQVATLLGMDSNTIFWHFDQFPLEHSVLSTKLTGDSLSVYKQCYPPNPPELIQSDWISSGGLGDKSAHDFSHHFILVSPPGVTWVAYKSNTPESDALFKGGMIMAAAIPGLVENKVKAAIELGRDRRLDSVPSADMQEMLTVGLTQAIKACEPLRIQAVDGEFAGIAPSMTKCNQVVEDLGLPPMFTPSGLPNWQCWEGGKPVRIFMPAVYVIFTDLQFVGRPRECFSVGITLSNKEGRVSCKHNRIRLLIRKGIPFKVLWTLIHNSSMSDRTKLESDIEQPIQQGLKTLWEKQWGEKGKEEFCRSDPVLNVPDSDQQTLPFETQP